MFKICLTGILLLMITHSGAQILPIEGSKLNYRMVGFSINEKPKQQVYNIEIAGGNFKDSTSFSRNIINVYECTGTENVLEVPFFGAEYTWRFYYPGLKTGKKSKLYHFSTMKNEHVDTSKLRLRVTKPATVACRDYFVSVDAGGVLYDMKGNPVWFIPDTNGIGGVMGDLNFTPRPSLTFIRNVDAYEIGFDGSILWHAPTHSYLVDTGVEKYHHEFVKLSNGHYMIMGMQILMCKEISVHDSNYIVTSPDRSLIGNYKPGRFGTLVEYDEKGKLVWSWKSSDHLPGTDFDYYKGEADTNLRFDPHENAFYFDEQKKIVYLGFRNLDRILKIEYPSGKILGFYGENFKPGMPSQGSGFFCNQHNISRTHDGLLYYFNNNSCKIQDSLPTIVLLQEPSEAGDNLKKVWEYTCTADDTKIKRFPSGGNVIELPDYSFFVCMGSEYSKMFIVNRDKEVLWSALPEKHHESEPDFRGNRNYRANIITRKYLEQLIWSAEKKNISK